MLQQTPQAWADYRADAALEGVRLGRNGGGWVVGQLGQSLDGRIATPTGASKYINGSGALRHLHRLRAAVDAVVIGVGTAVADDPRLTTRLVEGPSPVRVVIDPHGRLPRGAEMLGDGAGRVLRVTAPGAPDVPGTGRIDLDCADGTIPPAAIVAALAGRGLARLLIEGGACTLARFVDAGQLDELHLMVAPIVLGSGMTGLNLAPIDGLDQALRPEVRTMRFADGDMLAICRLARAKDGAGEEDEDAA
ncbi:MAG TPA: RibD family protein [Thermohalobaculum sp.]|nr:RibD family protein [Thermohalobaculum sp.]